MKTGIDHVTAMAKIGEAVVALVKESKLLRKKPGRRRGPYKKRRKAKAAAANGRDYKAERARRKRPLASESGATTD